MDGFTYEQTAGGWSVCDVCGVRVSEERKHAEWHKTPWPKYGWVPALTYRPEPGEDA